MTGLLEGSGDLADGAFLEGRADGLELVVEAFALPEVVVLGVAGAVVDFDQDGFDVGEEIDGAAGGASGVGWDGGRELRLSQSEVEGAGEDELRLLASGLAGDADGGEVLATGQRTRIDESEAGGIAGALEKVVLL